MPALSSMPRALFAERGFLGASIADLAKACDISKSLIYHYYDSKEDILFDVMHSHVRVLLDCGGGDRGAQHRAAEKLRALTLCLRAALCRRGGAPARAAERDRAPFESATRASVVGHSAAADRNCARKFLRRIRPEPGAPLKPPAAMLYFGMINWMHTWLDPSGRVNPRKSPNSPPMFSSNGIVHAAIAE